jgi:hypothetical protein
MASWARKSFFPALQRLDLLLHREILRLRAVYQLSGDEFRGLYISDVQVDELIFNTTGNTGEAVDIQVLNAEIDALHESSLQALAQYPPWRILCQLYDLSPVEQDVLLIAFAPELDAKYEVLYAYLNNDISRKYPTIDLLLRLLRVGDVQHYRPLFSDEAKLFGLGLLIHTPANTQNYQLQSGFQLSAVLRNHLLGMRAFDSAFNTLVKLAQTKKWAWQWLPFDNVVLTKAENTAGLIADKHHRMTIVIQGNEYSGAEFIAANLLSSAGFVMLNSDISAVSEYKENLTETFNALNQIAVLNHAGFVLSLPQQDDEHGSNNQLMLRILNYFSQGFSPLIVIVHPKSDWRPLFRDRTYLQLDLTSPSAEIREKMLRFCLDIAELQAEPQAIFATADFFQLDFKHIQAAVSNIQLQHARQNRPVIKSELFAAAVQQSYGSIGKLAQKVDNCFALDDLVLPASILSRVKEIIAAIHNRRRIYEEWNMQRRIGTAKGMMVMFAGASGTGKTMTASVIANEIGLDLYRIDLASMVSKYIGETEKNLDKVFLAARQANCILFFDEADALFGKRSEVKDAHDRYANIEIAYLLQKMEDHEGIVILTTNLIKNIDPAFSRRLQYVVEFPKPDIDSREQLWRGMFTDQAPLAEDVDFNFLARQFETPGGDIKNIALDAALLAANSPEEKIRMAHFINAASRHLIKQGKMPSATEFKQYFNLTKVNAN